MNKYFHEQEFGGGMRQDIEASKQPDGTYRYARNGRILFVRDQSSTSDGHSYVFSNIVGNKLLLSLPTGSTILHFAESRQGTVVFSVLGNSSEIGLWAFDTELNGIITPGEYTTLYTDSYDPHLKNKPYVLRKFNQPNQDRLGWLTTDRFDSEIRYENERIERIYWTNRRGTKHCLNVRAKPADSELTPLTGYYPSYWSAHAFRDRPDVVFPVIKLLGEVKENCRVARIR
ncbi:hypothetical protein GO730_00335 [Spirosoma sp. HMF3257]|uniref:Crassvirus muzzle protein N-terminal region domain-containing protein n=1 Tax=Spirosoma telluris TaxID=2183553 RepID=A0A327NDA6_9BACT|nr:hypothetical protein [Spirosoma telluris]RAI73250.1 hypothetical protein HMF3257_00320 [Spirosoma telluris]